MYKMQFIVPLGAVQCSTPSKQLQFVTLLNEKDVYNNLDFLRYKCSSPYNETSEGALMCQNGKWNGTFVCTSKSPQNLTSTFTHPVAKSDTLQRNFSFCTKKLPMLHISKNLECLLSYVQTLSISFRNVKNPR